MRNNGESHKKQWSTPELEELDVRTETEAGMYTTLMQPENAFYAPS